MTHPALDDADRLETFLKFSPDSKTLYVGGSWGPISDNPRAEKQEIQEARPRRGIGNIVGATADNMADGYVSDKRVAAKTRLEFLINEDQPYPIGGKFRSLKGTHGQMPGTVDAYRVSDGKWLRPVECFMEEADKDLATCKDADLSPDGSLLAVLGGDPSTRGEIHVFETASGRLLFEREASFDNTYYDLREIAFLPDSKRFLTWDRSKNQLLLHQTRTGRILDSISLNERKRQYGLFASSNGGGIVLGRLIFDARTAELKSSLASDWHWTALAVSRDGANIIGVPNNANRVELYRDGISSAIGEERANEIMDAAFSPDGRIAAVAVGRRVELWDLKTMSRFNDIDGHLRTVDLVAFSPDGKLLATNSQGGATRIWDITNLVRQIATNPEKADLDI